MTIRTLQRDIAEAIDKIDPIGGKIRKLKSRLIKLEKQKSVSASEFKEISGGWVKIKELEQQQKQLNQLEASLDKTTAKKLKLAKHYDNLTMQYEQGKIEGELYASTLRKIYAKLIPSQSLNTITLARGRGRSISGLVSEGFEQGCMALLLIIIIIPALFSCSFH